MRSIGTLKDRSTAVRLGDYLLVKGIVNQVDETGDGFEVWVHDEDRIGEATAILKEFVSNPAESRYSNHASEAERLRAKTEEENRAFQRRMYDRRRLFRGLSAYGLGGVTLILIVLCSVIFVVGQFGDGDWIYRKLMMADPDRFLAAMDVGERFDGLLEIRSGQFWRLLTPILLHGGFLHVFFNMLWLRELGSMIEARLGSWYFLFMVLVIGVFSNLGQFFSSGPNFVGFSGVVYGLLGYIWYRGRHDPSSGVFIHPSTVNFMLIWMAIGFLPVIMRFFGMTPVALFNMANGAHLSGLLIGCAWGYLDSMRRRYE